MLEQMVKRFAVAGALSLLVPGCSTWGYLAPQQQKGYFEPKSAVNQDPYWQRFYELEREIAQLKDQLGRKDAGAQPAALESSAQSEQSATATTDPAETGSTTEEFLTGLKLQADRAVKVIDDVLASLMREPATEPQLQTVTAVEAYPDSYIDQYATKESANPSSAQVAAAGSVQRSPSGEVVSQVTYSQERQAKYNYTLVYIYPEPQPWNAMWDRLEAANEQDKWRGFNPDKLTYFIYVGAYLREQDARERYDMLATSFGEGPEMRVHAQSTALASN